ncbi:MAG: hypothetical protein AB7O31_11170 [Burkholderiales bacterium]
MIRVTGDAGAPLEEFRERVRWLLVRDPDAPDYSEHHTADALEYRFDIARGIPFPAFVTVSEEFIGVRVEAAWPRHGKAPAGRAVIELGRLVCE